MKHLMLIILAAFLAQTAMAKDKKTPDDRGRKDSCPHYGCGNDDDDRDRNRGDDPDGTGDDSRGSDDDVLF